MKKINEETRTVSGFTEFTHNGKNSIMEDDTTTQITLDKKNIKNFHNAHSIVFAEFTQSFKNFYNAIKNIEEKKESIAYKSLINILKENKNIFNDKLLIDIKPIYIYRLDIKNPYAYGGFFINNNTPYIFISKLNLDSDKLIETYNAIIDILSEKKFIKMPILKIIGSNEMIEEKYFEKYKQSEDNPNIFSYDNPFYTKTNNKEKKKETTQKIAFDRENKTNEPENKISTDKSTFLDKKEKNKKEKTNSIAKTVANGYKKGINGAKNNANFLKTIYNAYRDERDKTKNTF